MDKRLIDTMTSVEVFTRLRSLLSDPGSFEISDLEDEIEKLFAEEPHWYAGLSLVDNQTWVFCFVSDDSPKERRYAEWISEVLDDGYRGPEGLAWTHATPVDLNMRYKKEW